MEDIKGEKVLIIENKWISKDVLTFDYKVESTQVTNIDRMNRAYEIWEHSRGLIESNQTDFHLSDGIANLKRSLNQRLQLIEDLYHLKSIKLEDKPKGYLELLEFLGVVRPFLMKQLLAIRNDIEHRDAQPPSFEKCLELLDAIWYFLKSTDYLVRYPVDTIVYEENTIIIENMSWVTLRFKFDSDILHIKGRLTSDFVYDSPLENTFQMECEMYCLDETGEDVGGNKALHRLDGEMKISGSEKNILIKKILNTI